ncbi:M24 family metallopeptidase [Conexibacter stalactiti]|uniref:M24 family metallopeptidase n=1 Tax=Conexibacter stalactiti TaxID=1940611 RepID=A0ABU4HSF7_9ACTN|nr:M24 family metallopeptidase [Conexibacter stalactiti]MDW5596245.1 M24 family metallopeptidase [Conexibacter stalactiti]MEC5036887.1 M24 family metallopeptidase [Conexibacter stalactiti]
MIDFPARRRRLSALAAARGLDGVLVFSWRRAAVAWCCGYTPGFATNWAALWIGRDGEATLGVRFPFELERAARESGLPCVEAPLPIAVVPLAARAIGIVAGDVAIDELPVEVAAELARCGIAHERLDDELNAWRAIKGPAEIAALKRAAAICSAALWAGASSTQWSDDFALAAAVEAACRARGATRALCLVGAGDGAVVTEPHGAPLPLDGPIGVELTIQLPDGSGHVCHTYAEGLAAQRCAAARIACERARAAIIATIAPGTPVDAVVAAGEAELARHGLLGSREYDFGHGIGLETPERPRLLAGLGERIAVGQVIAVHVGVRRAALGTWVTGGPVVVGDDGASELLRGAPWSAPDAVAGAHIATTPPPIPKTRATAAIR